MLGNSAMQLDEDLDIEMDSTAVLDAFGLNSPPKKKAVFQSEAKEVTLPEEVIALKGKLSSVRQHVCIGMSATLRLRYASPSSTSKSTNSVLRSKNLK
jgi:hypothetical protein